MNERRQDYENQPYGLAWEKLFSNLFSRIIHIHGPTIGWMENIAKFELDDVKNFFRTYYSPNNASIVVGGNFDVWKMKDLIEKYFGGIQKSDSIPDIVAPKQSILETKKLLWKTMFNSPAFIWHGIQKSFQ